MEHGISDSLLELLTRQDMRSKAVGAAELHGMKSAGPSQGKPSPAVTDAAREEKTRIRLVWDMPMRGRTTQVRRPMLMVVK